MAYLRFECQIGPRGDLKTSFRTLKFALLWKLDCESAAPSVTPNLLSAEVLSRKMASCTHRQPPALALPGILVWALLWAINFKKPCFGRKAELSPALGFSLVEVLWRLAREQHT